MFDDPEDDIYDGYLGENDHEDPRIELKITIGSGIASKSMLVSTVEHKSGFLHKATT